MISQNLAPIWLPHWPENERTGLIKDAKWTITTKASLTVANNFLLRQVQTLLYRQIKDLKQGSTHQPGCGRFLSCWRRVGGCRSSRSFGNERLSRTSRAVGLKLVEAKGRLIAWKEKGAERWLVAGDTKPRSVSSNDDSMTSRESYLGPFIFKIVSWEKKRRPSASVF